MNRCFQARANRAVVIAVAAALPVLIGGCSLFRKTIFYVNSYHDGYGPSDGVMEGMREVLRSSNVHLRVFMMDSIRYPDKELIKQRVEKALFEVEQYEPDVIIASDDNAVSRVIVPNFADGPVPCVFCGVDWRCDQYGLPTRNVTGMLEVAPIEETVDKLREYYPKSKTVFVLSGNAEPSQNCIKIPGSLWEKLGLTPVYACVETSEQWKEQFVKGNASADLIYLPTNIAITGWDDGAIKQFVEEQIRVPVLTCDYFMMPYAVFGVTKVPEEQGRWAAQTALKILAGKKPGEIRVTYNKETKTYFNAPLAKKIGFKPDEELLSNCLTVQ